ncbi:MAG: DNA-binding response regulator [Dehalococcoidia bacterium]|nr:MAG: DNA-binding response regulator [Dehalococcoidia bacterium]
MAGSYHILIIDDDPGTLRYVSASLRANAYRVTTARDGREAVDLAATEEPDLIVLDLAMPRQGGEETLAQLREWFNGPVIVLSAYDDERKKIEALDRGADDYVTKPFAVGELLARIRAALRRATQTPVLSGSAVIDLGTLKVDRARRVVTVGEREVPLTRTEFELLSYLALHAGRVVTQRQLLEEVWGREYSEDSNLLRTFIKQLRKKIEPEPAQPRWIVTVPGVGYRLDPAS